MKLRVLIAVFVVVGMLPVATAQMVPTDSPDATSVETSALSQPSDEGNRTKLYVERDYKRVELKPGESDSFTVSVKNLEDETVSVNPHLSTPPVGENLMQEKWVSIDGDTSIDAGEEQEFTVTVSVPNDAKLGRYRGNIAFTDETITYPGRPARPAHAANVNVRVWREPTVNVLAGNYMHSQVEAGDSYTHQILIENTGDEAVPVNPELSEERRRHYSSYGNSEATLDRSWLEIDAPAQIAPGETATVSVTVTPPENADRGRYRTELNLGLKDPARDEQRNHWQQIRLNFQVWKQPTEPFETSFEVSEDANNVSLKLSTNSRYRNQMDSSKSADFDVQFVSPDGEVIEAERVKVTDNGYVDLSGDRRRSRTATASGQDYAVDNNRQSFVYQVDDPAAGTWTARIMPDNVVRFNYEIVRDEN